MKNDNFFWLSIFLLAIGLIGYVFASEVRKTHVSRAAWIRANKLCYVTGVDSSGTFHCDSGWRVKMDYKD
jgi:hypothetical protein